MDHKSPVTLPDGYLDFYKNLESWQNEQEIILKRTYHPQDIDVLKLLAQYHKPVCNSYHFNLNPDQYKDIYLKLLALITTNRPETGQQINLIMEQSDHIDFAQLGSSILNDDAEYLAKLSSQVGISRELLVFTAEHALRPFLRLLASPYYELLIADEERNWDFANICPFCGGEPHFSRLRAVDGRRFMFCDRCFTEWETRYLACIHCGNDNPETIDYISIDNDPAYQVYTCQKCKGYLKSYDERLNPASIDLFIANIETIYLDLLAEERGYHNHGLE